MNWLIHMAILAIFGLNVGVNRVVGVVQRDAGTLSEVRTTPSGATGGRAFHHCLDRIVVDVRLMFYFLIHNLAYDCEPRIGRERTKQNRRGLESMVAASLAALVTLAPPKIAALDGVSFNNQRDALYVRARELADAFDIKVSASGKNITLGNMTFTPSSLRQLPDGTQLVRLSTLPKTRFLVRYDSKAARATIRSAVNSGKAIHVRRGSQRVVINKKQLMLVAWQGQSVVMRTKVGIGRSANQSPNGIFAAQAYRTPLHRSSLYGNAPMPWAIHVVGDIFLHGSSDASGRSSHGCIRLPMTGRNHAKWLYDWIQTGTPVTIQGKWPANAR